MPEGTCEQVDKLSRGLVGNDQFHHSNEQVSENLGWNETCNSNREAILPELAVLRWGEC